MRLLPRSVIGLVAALGVWGAAKPAAACGASPTPWYTVDRQAPQGEGVPLNAPLVIELLETATDTEVSLLTPTLELNEAGSSDVQLLTAVPQSSTRFSFIPGQELKPQTTYHASFRAGQVALSGAEPAGPTSATWEFTTGDTDAAPLTLEGDLQATLEAGQNPIYTCANDCGTDCVETGRVAVTNARVHLPKVSGGFGSKLFGTLVLTNDYPEDFGLPTKPLPPADYERLVSAPGRVEITPGEAGETLVSLPSEEQPYVPCFAFKAWDDRGDEVLAEPLCLDQPFPAPILGAGGDGGGGNAGVAGRAGVAGVAGASLRPGGFMVADGNDEKISSKSSSCSFARPRSSSAAWLSTLALLALVCRRRSSGAAAELRVG